MIALDRARDRSPSIGSRRTTTRWPSGDAFLHQRRQHARRVCAGGFVPAAACSRSAAAPALDTEFLARAGLPVVACDPSEEMVSRTKRRLVGCRRRRPRRRFLPCGLQQLPAFLDALDHAQGFDAHRLELRRAQLRRVLAPLGALAERHLRPGGAVLLGLMGRACAWEMRCTSSRAAAPRKRAAAGADRVRCHGAGGGRRRPDLLPSHRRRPARRSAASSRSTPSSASASSCRRPTSNRDGSKLPPAFDAIGRRPRSARVAVAAASTGSAITC